MKSKTKVEGSLKVAKNAFYKKEMWFYRIMNVKTNLMNSIRDFWSSKSYVL